MPNKDETNENLSKLLGFFNADKVMSKADMEELLQAIVSIMASHKKGTEAISEELRGHVTDMVKQIIAEHNGILEKIHADTKVTRSEIEKAAKAQNDRAFKRLQDLINNIQLPKDGKDADPNEVAEMVLAKIKLPENKEFVLTAEDVRDRLESLPDEDKDKLFTQLGSKEITNIKDTVEQRFADALNRVRLTSGKVKSLVAGTNISITNDGSGNYTITGTGSGSGDMEAATYDPQAIAGDAFDTDNHTSGTTNKVYTAVEQTKLAGIEALADVTDATNVDAAGAVMNSDTSTAAMQFVIDEDAMTSNSATKVPTQQSVKAYVDAEISGVGGGVSEALVIAYSVSL